MAFRGGRGRGRGFGRGDFRYAKQESVVLFPEVELPDRNNVTQEIDLIRRSDEFRRHFRSSPYFLEDSLSDSKGESVDIERYSDKKKAKKTSTSNRESLLSSGYLILEPGYFPIELVRGTKHRIGRKVQWNPKRDLQKLDFLEGLEEKAKDGDPKSKQDKEGEEDDEEEENIEEEEEDSDEGDYDQNIDFDDDEDDYNMNDDGDDEAIM